MSMAFCLLFTDSGQVCETLGRLDLLSEVVTGKASGELYIPLRFERSRVCLIRYLKYNPGAHMEV